MGQVTEIVRDYATHASTVHTARVAMGYPIEKAWENAVNRRAGTDLANIGYPISECRFRETDAAAGWGGARNRAGRMSDGIKLAHCLNLITAARYAAAAGLTLNRHVTIHWDKAGIPDGRAAWATGRLLKLASDWTAKGGGTVAHLWCRENGGGKGSHVHILLHVAAGREPWRMMRGWLGSITRAPYRAGTIETNRVGGTANAWRATPEHYLHNLAATVAYIIKGASPAAAAALSLERIERGGTIIGKRCGTSQNIGRSARRGAGWGA